MQLDCCLKAILAVDHPSSFSARGRNDQHCFIDSTTELFREKQAADNNNNTREKDKAKHE